MIPDFPHDIKTRLVPSKKPDVAKSLPCWLSQFIQDATKKISIWPILFLYYEESLVSSSLNSKLFRFHSAHPNLCSSAVYCCIAHTYYCRACMALIICRQLIHTLSSSLEHKKHFLSEFYLGITSAFL